MHEINVVLQATLRVENLQAVVTFEYNFLCVNSIYVNLQAQLCGKTLRTPITFELDIFRVCGSYMHFHIWLAFEVLLTICAFVRSYLSVRCFRRFFMILQKDLPADLWLLLLFLLWSHFTPIFFFRRWVFVTRMRRWKVVNCCLLFIYNVIASNVLIQIAFFCP